MNTNTIEVPITLVISSSAVVGDNGVEFVVKWFVKGCNKIETVDHDWEVNNVTGEVKKL